MGPDARPDLLGRVLAEAAVADSGGRVAEAGTTLDARGVDALEAAGVAGVVRRSAVMCVAEAGVCGRCAAPSLADEWVGLRAALELGESAPQALVRQRYWVC